MRQFAAGQGRIERANQTLQDRLVKEMRCSIFPTLSKAMSIFPNFSKISILIRIPTAQF